VPLNVLFMPGRTEYARLAELGVHRVSCGSLLFRRALQATVTAALEVAGQGQGAAEAAYPTPSYADVQALVAG